MWRGKSVHRFEDPPLLRGEGRFVANLAAEEGAAMVRFVRSTLASGSIVDIDTPEGATVFTAADLDDVRPLRPLLHREDYVPVDQTLLAADRVRFVGEPIAAVVAVSTAEAEDIESEVFVEIDPLDPVIGIDQALAGETRVHPDAPSNTMIDGRVASDAFETAVARGCEIVDIEVRSHRENAVPLECRGAYARIDKGSDRVTLYASIQDPHVIRTAIADLLGIPERDLRVIAPDVGGGFGQKHCLPVEYPLLVWIARRLRRNVAWIEDRRENFMSSFHSRDQAIRVRGAFTREGRLEAVDGDIRVDVGAYSCYPVTCGVEPLMALAELPGPYDFQGYSVRSRGFSTNTCPMAPYRGVSRPVITLAMERLMDVAARRLGIDAVEIRRRNLIDTFPYRSATGLVYDPGSYVESLEKAVEMLDLEAFRRAQAEALEHGRHLGVGFATFSERTGYGTPAFAARSMDVTPGYETVDLSMDPSGHVEARIGTSPHGQGLRTSLAQVIADELGTDPGSVTVVHGDTDNTPYGWGTFASRSMVLSGGAATMAARELKKKLIEAAADMLEAAAEDIELEDGGATIKGTQRSIGLSSLARAAYHASHKRSTSEQGLRAVASYDPLGTFSNACHVAIVDVCIETGAVSLLRFLVVEDAGLLINPMIVDGQIAGGVAQGIASALYEEIVYDAEGNILTTSLMDYLPPTAMEIPDIEIEHLVTISDATLTGAKGLGEGGAIGPPSAVLNAISDALAPLGVEMFETPATPERVRAAVRSAAGLRAGTKEPSRT